MLEAQDATRRKDLDSTRASQVVGLPPPGSMHQVVGLSLSPIGPT